MAAPPKLLTDVSRVTNGPYTLLNPREPTPIRFMNTLEQYPIAPLDLRKPSHSGPPTPTPPSVPISKTRFDTSALGLGLAKSFKPKQHKVVVQVPPPTYSIPEPQAVYNLTFKECYQEDSNMASYTGDLEVDTTATVVPVTCHIYYQPEVPQRSARILSGITELQGTVVTRFFGLWIGRRLDERFDTTVYMIILEDFPGNLAEAERSYCFMDPKVARWHGHIKKVYDILHDHGVVHHQQELYYFSLRGVSEEDVEEGRVDPATTELCLINFSHALNNQDDDFQIDLEEERDTILGLTRNMEYICMNSNGSTYELLL